MPVKVQSLPQVSPAVRNAALIVSASLFVAICAHISVPIPYTPVPFTTQNLAVLLVGLALGPRRGFAALALYLAEGAAGLPVFSPFGPGGVAQLIGPTGGYLMAYPFVAAIAGAIFYQVRRNKFAVALGATLLAEIVLLLCGTLYLSVYTHSLYSAALQGALPFLPLDAVKIFLASTAATRFGRD